MSVRQRTERLPWGELGSPPCGFQEVLQGPPYTAEIQDKDRHTLEILQVGFQTTTIKPILQ